MKTDNLEIVESEDHVLIFSKDQEIDISGYKTEKDLTLLYSKPFSRINARNIEAKTFVSIRRGDDGWEMLLSWASPDDITKHINKASEFLDIR